MRRHISYDRNKLLRKYDVEFKVHDKYDNLIKDMNVLAKLHQERMISIGKNGNFLNDRYRNFHFELAERLKEKVIIKDLAPNYIVFEQSD